MFPHRPDFFDGTPAAASPTCCRGETRLRLARAAQVASRQQYGDDAQQQCGQGRTKRRPATAGHLAAPPQQCAQLSAFVQRIAFAHPPFSRAWPPVMATAATMLRFLSLASRTGSADGFPDRAGRSRDLPNRRRLCPRQAKGIRGRGATPPERPHDIGFATACPRLTG